jgi:hypothetical protein
MTLGEQNLMSTDEDVTEPSGMPAQPATKQLPAVSHVEILLTQIQAAMDAGFHTLRADVGLISNDLGIVKDRVGIIESWKNDVDARSTRTSSRVRQASEQDMAHEAQLAQERAAREALATEVADLKSVNAKQTLMLATITGLLDKPLVKRLGMAVGALLLAALTTATGYLARGNVQTPQPTIIQVTK